jgi:hypothetical protein
MMTETFDNAKATRLTLRRDVLPVPFVELDLCFSRLLDQQLDIFGPERGVSAQQDIGDDPNHVVHHQRHLKMIV